MNAFVRDGAVNRKRRARQSLSARSAEPERKKIYKAHDDGSTPTRRDLALSTLQIHSGESSINQSKVVATDKESRYSNVEFTRAKAFLYLNYKKINSFNVNRLLKEHLKKFDENETHLKRIFEQCYDLTGSVEKSKAMMKQLATNTYSRLDLKPRLSSGVSERRLSIFPCTVVKKTVKKLKTIKNKYGMNIRLSKRIDDKNLTFFGQEYSSKDKKILYTIKVNDYLKPIEIYSDSDSTIISDEEEIGKKSCMLTKAYSLRDPKFNNFEVEMTPLIIDEFVENAESTVLETNGEIMVPKLMIDKNADDEEMAVPPLIIDEFVENAESTVLETDVSEIMIPKLITDQNVQSSKRTILETNTLVGKIVDLELEKSTSNQGLSNSQIDTNIDDSKKQSALETDVGEIMVPKLMDKNFENANSTALETNVEGENTVPLGNSEGPVLAQNIDYEEMNPLIIDEFVENAESTVLETDGEIMVPKLMIDKNADDEEMTPLIIDEFVENAESTVLETDGEIMVPKLMIDKNADDEEMTPLIIDEFVENAESTVLETDGEIMVPKLMIDKNADDEEMAVPPLIIDEFVENAESTVLETGVGEIMVPKLITDQNAQSSNSTILETSTLVGQIIDLELEKSTSNQDLSNSQIDTDIDDQDLANSQINELKIDTDIDDSEILDHTNLVLKIRKIINTDDEVFKNSIIKDLATYFLNDDFLYKVDALWKTTESELVGELVIKLLNMFNDIEHNMAQFTGCLICIFREIAQKSSILPCQLKLKLIVFLDAIKKYIKFHDNALWRTWFLPSMFFDWCFIVAFIFMNSKNEFKIDFNKSVIRNATSYYKMVKRCTYLFINQDLKPSKSHKKSGIFELTRIDDLLEIDDVHATNDTKVIPNISINIPSNEFKRKKLETEDNCTDTINHTTPGNIEEVCLAPVDPKIFRIKVRPQFSYANSFINQLNWFNNNVSDLMKKINVSTSNESIVNSTVQNNITVVDNNKVSSSVNKRRCVIEKATNEPAKRKKSKTQVASPRVFFTIANNPKEFDITYGSAIAQKSRSSAVSKNVSSSAAVLQSSVSPTSSQNLNPYYNHYSSSNTSSQLPGTSQTVASRSLSLYYNNINSNNTQVPIGLPSLSNTTQSSDARSTNPSVNINRTSNIYPLHSNNQQAIPYQSSAATNSQQPKAANTWPSNKYTNLCSDPSCSISSTYTPQYTNSTASSYLQSANSHNIPTATSHPQYSNALTYPKTYTKPFLSDMLASNTARVASMNTYMQHQNFNYSSSYSSQNNLKTPDHNTQVSPDLPDVRLPNMPYHQAADTITQTCMAANCANFSSLSCNTCLAAYYCSIQCQKSDWHYHQNNCYVSF